MKWLRQNLFSSPFNTALTLGCLALFWVTIPPALEWLLWNATWTGTSETCRQGDGACWAFIGEKLRFILFGTYPYDFQWRAGLATMLFFGLVIYSQNRKNWHPRLTWIWALGILSMGILMGGGLFGLAAVESEKWGGLPLTLMLSAGGIVCSYPFAILLALGRRSNMPAIRTICVVFIETIRGVPLISLLFMASVMIPLFFPEGFTLNKILRAQIAIILFVSAYLAEVIRGGLQAIPKGQYEAADALGLSVPQKMRLIILPQALKIVIPPTVNIFISVLKDTTLVVIISMFDLLGAGKAALADPNWLGFGVELYVFLAFVYFVLCYSMAQYSLNLEKSLNTSLEKSS